MTNTAPLLCDGCGQVASPGHVARRLQRLEWATRYRPIHVGTLLLGALSAREDADFLYAPDGTFRGEAALVLEAAGITSAGKTPETTLSEFQRGGFFLAHALECPAEGAGDSPEAFRVLMEPRLTQLLARIRRSLKPKRLVPISQLLDPVLERLKADELGSTILFDRGKAFALDGEHAGEAVARLREALAAGVTARLGTS